MRLVTADLSTSLGLVAAGDDQAREHPCFDGVAGPATVPVSSRTTPHVSPPHLPPLPAATGSMTDWRTWHADYDDPSSPQSERLRLVQRHIGDWLDATAPRPVTVLSSCAGDGRDLLEVLAGRSDAGRVSATLIETDPRNAASASDHVRRAQLSDIAVRRTDAGTSDAYLDAVPADLVLLCGIFGNIADDDVRRTIAATSQLCDRDAVVIWTRHRRDPDLTPRVREWFREHGFREEHFEAPDHAIWSVGVHRFVGTPSPLVRGQHLFTFVR